MEIDTSSAPSTSTGSRPGRRGYRGGKGRGRGGHRGGRGGRGGGRAPSREALDMDLDNYMMKDTKVAKANLDNELDAYMAQN